MVILFVALRPREPVYEGRTLSEWMADLEVGHNPEFESLMVEETEGTTSGKAAKAIRSIGTNSIPHLVASFDETRPEQLLKAMGAIELVGTNADACVPWLLNACREEKRPFHRGMLAWTIARTTADPQATAAIMVDRFRILAPENGELFLWVVGGRVMPSRLAVPILAKLAREADGETRAAAMRELQQLAQATNTPTSRPARSALEKLGAAPETKTP
ncbi:MAG: hypothetical protein AB1705_14150 [Verrucomicrobiota bacterium]